MEKMLKMWDCTEKEIGGREGRGGGGGGGGGLGGWVEDKRMGDGRAGSQV